MTDFYVILDKIKWRVITNSLGKRTTQPYCPNHLIRLYPINEYSGMPALLKCAECVSVHRVSRDWSAEKQYVLDKTESKILKEIKFLNLDDEAVPVAEGKIPKNSEYFVTAVLTESKVGKRLIIYAGKNGDLNKTQIFIEPKIKRLSFDQNDKHPTEIFTKVEATFRDTTTASLEKKDY